MFIQYFWRAGARASTEIRNIFFKNYRVRFHYRQKRLFQSVADSLQQVDIKKKCPVLQPNNNGQIKTKFDRPVKKPARDPLAKGFFCGKADTELLAYPEAVTREEMTALCKDVGYRLQHLKETFDSESVLTGKSIDGKLFENLKHSNSFGTFAPVAFGGQGYNITQQCYSFEAEAEDLNVASILCSHQLFTSILNDYGTDIQKNVHLPQLAKGLNRIFKSFLFFLLAVFLFIFFSTGAQIGTIALFEATTPNSGFFNTTAVDDDDVLVLNGEKCYVVNAINAKQMIVLVQTRHSTNSIDEVKNCTTAVIVDSSLPGVHIHSDDVTIGFKSVPQAAISFKNVKVNKEQILGTINHGHEIAKHILFHSRIQSGLLSLVLARKLIKTMTRFCIENKEFGEKLM